MVLMKSLVLEKKGVVTYRDAEVNDELGAGDVRVKIHSVGICGSDVHYVEHGQIGPFVVKKPMILGHECSGTVIATGANVKNLKVGDRVAIEPGIPRFDAPEVMEGLYNLEPSLTFFATPPIDGCCCDTVIHSAALCFKLPDNVSFAEGAMCEPVAVGMHAATKAQIRPGDVALVIGSGTIGIVTALSALAGGCSDVVICDVAPERLKVASQYKGLHPVDSRKPAEIRATVDKLTTGRGVDRIFECSGAVQAYGMIVEYAAPGAVCVIVGMPADKMPQLDIVNAQAKEITFQTIFRYRNVYPKVIRLISSGKINVKPLISASFPITEGIKAYERALKHIPTDVKIMIQVDQSGSGKL